MTSITDGVKGDGSKAGSVVKLSTCPEILDFLKFHLQGQFALNLRTKEIELSGQPVPLDFIDSQLSDKYGISFSRERLISSIALLAHQNAYDPVKRYLEALKPPAILVDFDWLAIVLFGVENPLHRAYLRCWLIGCVARVYEPGCKFDETLILQGKQGIGKSTLFLTLAGQWFGDSMTGELGKDDLMIFGRNWINEWAELDGVTAKKYHGEIKHFLSKREDTYRLPYGRATLSFPRRSVVVGTTNRDDFLTDYSGNRRHWVIPVAVTIALGLVEEKRDAIWATAVQLYKAGESWHLPQEFWADQAEVNKSYEQVDPWEEILLPYLDNQSHTACLPLELLKKLEDNGVKVLHTKPEQMRLAEFLRKCGWVRKVVRRGDGTQRVWIKPESYAGNS